MNFEVRVVKNGFEMIVYTGDGFQENDVYVFTKPSQVVKAVKELVNPQEDTK